MKPLQSTFFFLHSRVLALPRFAIEKCNLSNCSFPPREALVAAAAAAAASRSSGRSFMCALQMHKPPDVHQVKRWGGGHAARNKQLLVLAIVFIYVRTLPLHFRSIYPHLVRLGRGQSLTCVSYSIHMCVCVQRRRKAPAETR